MSNSRAIASALYHVWWLIVSVDAASSFLLLG
jgi:hypothetical protein